ncbi:glycosyltransferase family 4 protein [Ancylobacter radicis]|uniref:Glycosyltransferase family 4 protein n=1 Tax=Ancylobacter radicis TaxID=2836179 RepID=A0ABS5R1N3_9HYPH|nr:glycosyltransferase family 4 protein [Ancylobacter radicis]MBS9475569.1 glycosyltransferase family 4 protein [Ancylobacter radicis]
MNPNAPSPGTPLDRSRHHESRSHEGGSDESWPDGIVAVAPSFKKRFSGVVATVIGVVPAQARHIAIRALGPLPARVPQLRWRVFRLGSWRRPSQRRWRIWHARRDTEMMVGILLRDLLRQPWKLVFTSAAQKRHGPFLRFLIARMDRVIATSPQAASYLDVPSTVVMHGVDTDTYHPAPDRAAAWAATGLPGRHGIGVFGRVRYQKGQDLFVEAMIELLPAHPDWTAVVIGLSTPSEQSFLTALKARIAAAGLEARLLILGEQPIASMPGWFRCLSVAVIPARWEGFGLVPIEAMASGTPVVAARAGAAAELVRDGETGHLVPVDDQAALTAAIARLMGLDEGAREAVGRAARAHVLAEYSIEREAQKINAVYEEIWRG